MTEMERDYIAAKAFELEIIALLLKLGVIVLCVFMGLWTLGLVIMYWYVIIPAFFIVAWWASSNSTTRANMPNDGSSM